MQPTALSSQTRVSETAQRIGAEVAARFADEVDREARFPTEAIDALRFERMLSMFVPVALGGDGCSISELSAVCTALGQHCAATGMVFAMHQIQVACIARHAGDSAFFTEYLASLVEKQSLIASATSEIGVSGDVRSSVCSADVAAGTFSVTKQAPVISYAEHADAILVTARRAKDSPPSDQILALLDTGDFTLARTTDWNTLGFRGTCSPGFTLTGSGAAEQILSEPFASISCETMLPVSHILWSSLWLGMATAAVTRARAYMRAEARRNPGKTPTASVRLADVVSRLQVMRAVVGDAVQQYETTMHDSDALSGMSFAIRMNNLKLVSSTMLVEIVGQCMLICGMAGYGNESKFSLGRLLRDAYGAALMINNDRISGANASMLLVSKDD